MTSAKTDSYRRLADIVLGLEAEMRAQNIWAPEPPPPEALASQEPFCIDTLNFNQWLQFVFIERVKILIESQLPLPESSDITAIAEEFYRGSSFDTKKLMQILSTFDQEINA